MAISETALKETALMTIADINAKGGVMGRQIEPVVVDPASNWPLFAEKARQLITQDKVVATFGCWTSVSRKSVLPVFKELNSILYYPVQYEGEELEKNVFYTGAAPNQQAIPATEYLMSKEGGAAKRFFLLGTDYVYPRTTNKILRAFLKSKGVAEKDIEEVYTPFGHSDYQTIVANIKKFAAGGKTCVISTINGDSNVPFYKELGNAGLKAKDVPVVAFSVGEEELRGVDTKPLVGHLAAWNYFMSLKNPQNEAFIKMYKDWAVKQKLPNADKVVTNDPMEATYVGIHMWKQAVEKAKSIEADKVIAAMGGQIVCSALRLHDQDGRDQPPPVAAGVHRRDPGRRPVQRRVEDRRVPCAHSRGARSSPATRRSPTRLPESAVGAQDTDPWNGGVLRAAPSLPMLHRFLRAFACVLALLAAPASAALDPATRCTARCRGFRRARRGHPQARCDRGSACHRDPEGARRRRPRVCSTTASVPSSFPAVS